MRKFAFLLPAALFVTVPIVFSISGEIPGQSNTPNQGQAQVQQTQGQPQNQGQAQVQQTQVQPQNQGQAQVQQTQVQPQNQGQAQAQQTQVQPQNQGQAQAQQIQGQPQNQGQAQAQQTHGQPQNQGQTQLQQTQVQPQNQEQQQQRNPTYVQVGRNWKIGTTWSVETINLQRQGAMQKQSSPVVWVFTVVGETKIGTRDCFEVVVRCKDDSDRQPHVSIWVDKVSGMLMRTTSSTLVKGQWRTFTETYSVPEGKSVAVLGSIPSLPLDMPLFTEETGSKDIGGMTYEVISGNLGAKALGEIGFTYQINQSVKPVSEEQSQELTGAKSLAASLNLKDAVEVELKIGTKSRCKQIWLPDTPWPVYSTNGISESRLLDVTIPQQSEE